MTLYTYFDIFFGYGKVLFLRLKETLENLSFSAAKIKIDFKERPFFKIKRNLNLIASLYFRTPLIRKICAKEKTFLSF